MLPTYPSQIILTIVEGENGSVLLPQITILWISLEEHFCKATHVRM